MVLAFGNGVHGSGKRMQQVPSVVSFLNRCINDSCYHNNNNNNHHHHHHHLALQPFVVFAFSAKTLQVLLSVAISFQFLTCIIFLDLSKHPLAIDVLFFQLI